MRPSPPPIALAFALWSALAVGAACGEAFSSGSGSTTATAGSGGAGTSTSSMGGDGGSAASAGTSSDGGTGATSSGGAGTGATSSGGAGTGATNPGGAGTSDGGSCVTCAAWWSFCVNGPIQQCEQPDPFCTATDGTAAAAVRTCVCYHCSNECTDLCAIDAGGARAEECSSCIDSVVSSSQCTTFINTCSANH